MGSGCESVGLGSEEACRDFLAEIRWGDQFRCDHCGPGTPWVTSEGKRVCPHCDRQHSVTAGTSMHRTRISLTTWVGAALWMLQRGSTASAGSLREEFGIGSNNTARSLHRALESWMAPDSESQLSGVVQVESVEISGEDRGCTSHSTLGQLDEYLVASEARRDGSRGDLRVTRIPPDAAPLAAQVARWEFLNRAIAPTAEPEFGEQFRSREEPGKLLGPPSSLDPQVLETYGRWGRTARPAGDSRLISAFGLRIRDELRVGEGCVSRTQVEHYVRKAQFLWRHDGDSELKRLRRIFHRALGGGSNTSSSVQTSDDLASDRPTGSPCSREAGTATSDNLPRDPGGPDAAGASGSPDPSAESLDSQVQGDLFEGPS